MRLLLLTLAACGGARRPPREMERVAPEQPIQSDLDAGYRDRITTTTTEEDGRIVITMHGPVRIFCERRIDEQTPAGCYFSREKCPGDCIERTAMSCFRGAKKLTGNSDSFCFDRIADCEAVRWYLGQKIDFRVDPACAITRLGDE